MYHFFNTNIGTGSRAVFAAIGIALTSPVGAQAATLSYKVTGDSGGSQVITRDQAIAQSFTMNQTLTDASISFDVLCYLCSGDIYLITGKPMIGALVGQFETTRAYTIDGNATLGLSGRTLEANQEYTLIWSVFEGDGLWRATREAISTGTAATFGSASWAEDVDQGYPANSAFTELASTAKFQITGTGTLAPSPVPLTGSMPLLLSALIGLGIHRRRITKT